jgi:hypothetical protein
MFTKVIDSCFGRYGEMGKQVEEAIKAALPTNLSTVFELTRYNDMIAKALQDKWENSGVEADMVRRAQEAIDEVLSKDQMPEVISLQGLLDAFVEEHKENAAEERWERPDVRFKESEYGGLHIYFDKKSKGESSYSSRERSEYSLDNAVHISFDKRGKDRDEKAVKSAPSMPHASTTRGSAKPYASGRSSRSCSPPSTSAPPRSWWTATKTISAMACTTEQASITSVHSLSGQWDVGLHQKRKAQRSKR